jgi:hypothetical protein
MLLRWVPFFWECNFCISRSVGIALVQFVAVVVVHLSGEVSKLILVAHVLEHDQVLGFKRYVPAETS